MAYKIGGLIDSLSAPGWNPLSGPKVSFGERWFAGRDTDLDRFPWPDALVMRPERRSKRDDGSLYDLMQVVGNATLASRKARDLIEGLEPGVHDFPPVRLIDRACEEIDAAYAWIDIGQAFNAIHRAGSEELRWVGMHRSGTARLPGVGRAGRYGHVMSSRKIAGRHLWTGNMVERGQVFLSDALTEAFRSELRLDADFHHVPEVDAPWSLEQDLPELVDYARRNPEAAEVTLTEEWKR